MPFDIAGARQAGYSDSDIAEFLAQQRGFNLNGARQAGYSDSDIIGFLGAPPKAAQPAAPAPAPVDTSSIDKEIAAKQAEITQAQQQLQNFNPMLSGRSGIGVGQTLKQNLAAAQQDLAALQRRKQDSLKKGKLLAAPTTGQIATEALLKAPARGAIKGVSDIASAAGIFGPTGENIARTVEGYGTSAINAIGAEQIPEMQYSGPGQRFSAFGETLGGVVPFLASEGLGGISKAAKAANAATTATKALGYGSKAAELSMATGMGAHQARQTMDDFEKSSGQVLDPETRALVQAGGATIGAAMPAFGVARRILGSAAPEVSAAANGKITGILASLGANRITQSAAAKSIQAVLDDVNATVAGRVVTQGIVPTGAVMGGMQFGQNALASTYDPNQDLMQGVGQTALMGGLTGGLLRGGVEGYQHRVLAKAQANEANALAAEAQANPVRTINVFDQDPNNPGQQIRRPLDIMSHPDENGNVIVRHPDSGALIRVPAAALDSLAVGDEGHEGYQPSDAFSQDFINQRLLHAAGEEPDHRTASMVDAATRKLSSEIALGRPQAVADYLSDLGSGFTKEQTRAALTAYAKDGLSAVSDPRMRVWLEGRSILNDYRAEFARAQAEPGVSFGEERPAPTGTIEDMLAREQQNHMQELQQRQQLLNEIAGNKDIVDKHGAFAEELANRGLSGATVGEATALRDAMRAESDAETAQNKVQGGIQNKAAVQRMDIIERALNNEKVPNVSQGGQNPKIAHINEQLANAGQEPLNPGELDRVYGRAVAQDVYGPGGEYEHRYGESPSDTIARIENALREEKLTPDSPQFSQDPRWANDFEQYLEAKVKEATAPREQPSAPAAEAAKPKQATEEAAAPEVGEQAQAETVQGVPVTKVAPGTARGVAPIRRGMMGSQMGRPVEGAAELTPGMQAEQNVTRQLNNLRTNNMISDQDVGDVLGMMRAPRSAEELNNLPPSQRERWKQVLDLTRDLNEKSDQLEQATGGKEKKQLGAAIKQINKTLDGLREGIASAAAREAQFRSAKRRSQRSKVNSDYAEGKITKAERDQKLAALKVDKALRPTVYMRGEETPGEGSNQVSVERAQKVVDEATEGWAGKPDISVVNSTDDLPPEIRQVVEADGAQDALGLVAPDGRVYLFAGNANSEADVRAALFHEALGHVGLSKLFREKLDDALTGMYNSNAGLKAEVNAWREKNPDAYAGDNNPLARAVEEVLAKRSENGKVETSLFARVAAVVRNFGRRIGLVKTFSDGDVAAVLSMAHDQVTRGVQESSVVRGLRYMTAWHGSPHDFDKFSTEHMGKGEGAQAFGWGLYFASNKAVAEHYKEATTRRQTTIDGVPFTGVKVRQYLDRSGKFTPTERNAILYVKTRAGGDVGYALRSLGWAREGTEEAKRNAEYARIIKQFQESGRLGTSEGKLYEVNLAPKEEEFLDWNKPLHEQTEQVKQSLRNMGVDPDAEQNSKYPSAGADFYRQLTKQLGGKEAASKALLENGIRGNKYLDANSRGPISGEPSRNYVVFDDSDVNISNKYMRPEKADGPQSLRDLLDKDAEKLGLPEGARRENPNQSPRSTMDTVAQMRTANERRVSDMRRKFEFTLLDAEDLDRWQAQALGLERMPEEQRVSSAADLLRNQRNNAAAAVEKNFEKPMFDIMAEEKVEPKLVAEYLWARGAADRNRRVAERNAQFPTGGSGLTDAQAKAMLTNIALSGKGPALERIAKIHDAMIRKMQDTMVREGLISKKDMDELRAAEPYYTPLKGFAADGDMTLSGDEAVHSADKFTANLGITRNMFSKAQGRESMPFSPLENALVDAKRLGQKVAQNRVGKQVLNSIRANPDIWSDVAKVYTDAEPKVTYRPDPRATHPEGIPVRENMRASASNYIVVKDNGTTYYIDPQETEAGQALKRLFQNMNPEQLQGALKQLDKMSSVLRSLDTARSPLFLERMMMRDPLEAAINAYSAESDKSSPAYNVKGYAKAVVQNLNPTGRAGRAINSAIWGYLRGHEPVGDDAQYAHMALEQLLEDGGASAHSWFRNAEDSAERHQAMLDHLEALEKNDPRAAAKDFLKAAPKFIENAVQLGEMRVRLASYMAALEKGLDRRSAARLALSSYVDFSRKGEVGRQMDAVYWFANAKTQTLRMAARALKSPNGRKLMLAGVGLGMALGVNNIMMGGGDDDNDGRPNWLDVPERDKLLNFVIRTGPKTGDYIKIPNAFVLAPFLYAGQKVAEYSAGAINHVEGAAHLTHALHDLAAGWGELLSPVPVPRGKTVGQVLSSMTPSAFAPVAQVAANRNFFDSPIYSEHSTAGTPRWAQGREGTSDFYKGLARRLADSTSTEGNINGVLDMQPEVYKHLVESYGGGAFQFGRQVTQFATGDGKDEQPMVKRIPGVKGFFGGETRYIPMSRYYDTTADMQQVLAARKDNPERFEQLRAKYPLLTDDDLLNNYKSASDSLRRMSRARAQELRKAANADERKAIIEEYRGRQLEVYKDFNRGFNDIRKKYEQ